MQLLSMDEFLTKMGGQAEYGAPVDLPVEVIEAFSDVTEKIDENEHLAAFMAANAAYVNARVDLARDMLRKLHKIPDGAKIQLDLLLGQYRVAQPAAPTTPAQPEWAKELIAGIKPDSLM